MCGIGGKVVTGRAKRLYEGGIVGPERTERLNVEDQGLRG